LENAVSSAMNFQLALSNLHIAHASQKTNEVMRTLTLFSVVFLPLTLIAGIYGMNFQNMPELQHEYGYFGTLILMAFVALGLLFWFKSKGYTSLRVLKGKGPKVNK
jgi:magnesium transporter